MPLPAYLLERLKKRKIILEEKSEPTKSNEDSQRTKRIKPTEQGESSNYGQFKDSSDIGQNQDEEIIVEDYSDSEDEDRDEPEEESDQSGESDDDNEGGTDNDDDDDNSHSDKNQEEEGRRLISDNDTGDQTNNNNLEGEDRPLVPHATESVLGCPNKYNIYHECSRYCVDKYGSLPKDVAPSQEQRKQLALLLRTFPMTNDWSVVYDPGVRTFYFWNIISNQVSWFPPGMSTFASPSADHIRRLMRENYQTSGME